MGTILQLGVSQCDPNPVRIDPPVAYGVAFLCASLAFCLKSLIASRLGVAMAPVAILGNVTCGWSWLATRALFRPRAKSHIVWPLAAVLLLMASYGAMSLLTLGEVPARILGNLARLGSSAMLILAVAEPLLNLRAQRDNTERQFRIIYAASYLAILGVAVLALDGAPQDSIAFQLSTPIKTACAIAAVCGYALALTYRRQHPLETASDHPKRRVVAPDLHLGELLTRLMSEKQLYAEPELRVADLARLAGEHEYKVTQCISGTLGYPNFNQMVNRYRIDEAARRLADPALSHLPILTIAMDCGFGSIGPFNRAFKAAIGMTPKEYRHQQKVR